MPYDALGELSLHYPGAVQPPSLPALPALFAQAEAAGLLIIACTHPGDEEARRRLAKRRHDLKAALRTLAFMVKALGTGYTFQDEAAAAKTQAIGRAVAILEREGEVLARLFTLE